eukprot:TRINITY_DN13986_c0_g1_i1.p2 TRINITY_DN13986_c0_g1~~TRINITY_DN13986_c0_g1_i1.p2  ORF type:complete len:63 (+),score=5.85 TRINITY_DN13986_c0_g1_i1:160-348(+)
MDWLENTKHGGGTNNLRSTLITFGSIVALNLPALISKLEPNTLQISDTILHFTSPLSFSMNI